MKYSSPAIFPRWEHNNNVHIIWCEPQHASIPKWFTAIISLIKHGVYKQPKAKRLTICIFCSHLMYNLCCTGIEHTQNKYTPVSPLRRRLINPGCLTELRCWDTRSKHLQPCSGVTGVNQLHYIRRRGEREVRKTLRLAHHSRFWCISSHHSNASGKWKHCYAYNFDPSLWNTIFLAWEGFKNFRNDRYLKYTHLWKIQADRQFFELFFSFKWYFDPKF